MHSGRKIHLHSNDRPFVRTAIQISNVAPAYAPPGRFLLTASLRGIPPGDDAALFAQAHADLRRLWTGDRNALAALDTLQPLAVYRIPYGQFPQPPGVYPTLPDSDPGIPGLRLAGEFTAASSLNAALRSGEKCAAALLVSGVTAERVAAQIPLA